MRYRGYGVVQRVVALPLIVRCDSRRAGAHRRLTCLDGEAGGPQEDGGSLLMALAG
jgi:hypothetical protein